MALGEPLWSGAAIDARPDLLARIHAEYAAAGATVHTAATFRTGPWNAGADATRLTAEAVRICRDSVPSGHRVLGSLAPLADCYRPQDTPTEVRGPHRAHARSLQRAGVDGILVETFADPTELAVAVEEAVGTGLPVWASFTAGPDGSLVDVPTGLGMARAAVDRGAEVVLVNCTAVDRCDPWCEALASTGLPWGVYPNAGARGGPFGWDAPDASAIAPFFARWLGLGASVVGACCGMGPAHVAVIAALSRRAARATTPRTPGSAPPP
ncbi:MAG: homocysteine S-methyltransferase family protein [Alphaproteobacteria bacterium]|nr:homocysteine S-methyltransferase family protein [Alphaproteobacteria bacterium]